MYRSMILLLILFSGAPLFAQVQLPQLEEYDFQIGDSPGVELNFLDPRLAGGGAQVRFHLRPVSKNDYEMNVEVFRHVSQGTITFALLLERVEIAFFNASGALIRTIIFDKVLGESGLFIIGDSSDGYFQRKVRAENLGAAARLTLSLFGNYE